MLRIELERARPGMTLALPVYDPQAPSRILLKTGFELQEAAVRRLADMGIRSLWVRYPSLQFVEKFVDAKLLAAHGKLVQEVTSSFTAMQKEASARLPFDDYCKAIGGLIDRLLNNSDAAVFMDDLSGPAGGGLMRHSAAVTYLAVLMGLKLEGYLVKERRHVDPIRAKEVTSLGLGAMLHDVGVMHIDPDARRRYYATGDESEPQWQDHPRKGFEIVRGKIEPSAATVVLHHHQRLDGSGYAGQGVPVLAGKSIHIFARIVGLAEQFDRMRHPAGLPAQPTVWVLRAILEGELSEKFDPTVVHALMQVAPPYPPGSIVRLSDGRWAVCLEHSPTNPCRPRVQITPPPDEMADSDEPGEIIDLAAEDRSLQVAVADGREVAELNFHPRDFSREAALAAGW